MPDSRHDDIPISDRTLDALRTTAAMVVAVPPLAAMVRIGEDVLLEVRRRPHLEQVEHRVIPPCGFHGAVAGAHRLRRAGQRVGMHGLPDSVEPAIDWGVAAGAHLLPGRMVRVDGDVAWSHMVPVAVPEDEAVRVLLADPDRFRSTGWHGDSDLDVVILHRSSPAGDEAASRDAVVELASAVGAIGVADLEHRLGATSADQMSSPD